MQQDTAVIGMAHVIQLSDAPVFLLTGIGAILAVLINRVSRVVDRARVLEREVLEGGAGADSLKVDELRALARRAVLIGRAIALCTITALLISAVIAILFLGAFVKVDTSPTVALLFIAAMLALFLGLLMFLREILLAIGTLRIGLQHVPGTEPPSASQASQPKGPGPQH